VKDAEASLVAERLVPVGVAAQDGADGDEERDGEDHVRRPKQRGVALQEEEHVQDRHDRVSAHHDVGEGGVKGMAKDERPVEDVLDRSRARDPVEAADDAAERPAQRVQPLALVAPDEAVADGLRHFSASVYAASPRSG